ncbi:MAG: hypothetical protein H6P99_2869 [Holophagaceae bacterium]|nr:hypothetical protein [Holophagaceae bacterium]
MSSLAALVVTMRIGMAGFWPRTVFTNSRPSISGMFQSVMIISTPPWPSFSSPLLPFSPSTTSV